MWRHGTHVGGQEQKHFSPLGTKFYLNHVILWGKILLFSPPTWPPCHVVANQELQLYNVPCIQTILDGYLVQVGETTPYPKKCHSIKQTRENAKQPCNLNQKIPMKSLLPHPCHPLDCLHPPVFWSFWIGYIACLITRLSIASSLITV